MIKTLPEAENFVKNVIALMGFDIEESEINTENDLTTISIKSKDSRNLIGRDGETLFHLNSLLHRFLESGISQDEKPISVSLDINGFQKKKIDDLKVKAHMMAERAKFFKSSVDLPPMNGYERKVIHSFLENDKNIKTESNGVGKDRHIVMSYIENKESF
jgi:spoIIIJ-associated protein